jgi:DUF971 family protein
MSEAPIELRVSKDRRELTIRFANGESGVLTAEMLRVFSPSAEVQGHSPEERVLQWGKANVAILSIEPVGRYAIRIGFDDMHDTGIFSWAYLRELLAGKEQLWQEYLRELEAKGKNRER